MLEKISEKQAYIILGIAIILSFVLAFVSVSQYKSFGADEQNYMYGSYLETQGLHAFKDYFNNVQKVVGTLWASMPFFWVFGPTFNGLIANRIFLLLLKSASTIIVYFIGMRIFKNRAMALSSAVVFAFCSLVIDASYLVGTYPFPVFLSCLAIYSYFSEWKYKYFFTGLFLGLQVLFRLDAGLIGIVFGIFILAKSWKAALSYVAGTVLGALPLFVYLLVNNSWIGFYRAAVVFPRIYPLEFQSTIAKIISLIIGARYDFAIILLVVSLASYWLFTVSKEPWKDKFIYEKPFFLFSAVILCQLIFILAYPKFAFYHYMTLFIVPTCLIAGYSFVFFLRQDNWARFVSYAAVVILVVSSVTFFFFPLQPINNNFSIIFEEMQKHPHDKIFTAHEQIFILFAKTDPIYIGKNNQDAFERSKLDEVIYSPTLDEIRNNPDKYDIIYLTDYSEVNISEENYTKICAPSRRKTLIYYAAGLVERLGVSKALSIPTKTDHFSACYDYYYVRKS